MIRTFQIFLWISYFVLSATAYAVEATPTSDRNLVFVPACIENTTASCLYETLIVGATVSAQQGIHMASPHFEYQRRERTDQIIRDLLDLGEYEIAEHYALRELAQRHLINSNNTDGGTNPEFYGAISNGRSAYQLYMQAVNHNSLNPVTKTYDQAALFERQYSDERYKRYMEDRVYIKIEEGDLAAAAQFLDGLKLKLFSNKHYIFRVDDLGAIHLREYIDAIYALSRAYAAKGDIERAQVLLKKLEDRETIDRLLRWEKIQTEYTGSKGSTFEFLDAMIGPGAGTDSRTVYIGSLVALSRKMIEEGNQEKAKKTLEKSQEVASLLDNPSLSRSKAFVILSGAQAQAKNYVKAYENADEVRTLCCTPLNRKQPIMQDANHLDWAFSGIVTGALYNNDYQAALDAAGKMSIPFEQALVWQEIAQWCQKHGNIKDALIHLNKAEMLIESIKYPEEKAQILQLVAETYFSAKEPQKAINSLDRGTEIYLTDYKKFAWNIDTPRQQRFQPAKDLIYNYGLQNRLSEIPKILLRLDENLGNSANIIYDSAVIAAQRDNKPAMGALLQLVASHRAALKIRSDQAWEKSIAEGRIKAQDWDANKDKYAAQAKKRQTREDFDAYLNLATAFASKKNMKADTQKFYELAQNSLLSLQSFDDNEDASSKCIDVAKMAVLEALLQDTREVPQDRWDSILILVRAMRNADGYSFSAKHDALLKISRIFQDFGFEQQAEELLEYSRLMADRINSSATRHMVPRNDKQINAAYARLVEEYINRGQIDKTEEILGSMADDTQRVKTHGTERSLFLIKEKWTADLILAALEKGNTDKAAELAETLSLPLYQQITYQSLLAQPHPFPGRDLLSQKLRDDLSLEEVIKHAWDDEELIDTAFYLLKLAKVQNSQDKKPAMQRTLDHATRIIEAFYKSHRSTQGHILLADFYNDIGKKNEALLSLDLASKTTEHLQFLQQELSVAISERYLALGFPEKAKALPVAEARSILGYFTGYAEGKRFGNERVEQLIPIAKSLAVIEQGLHDKATRNRLISFIDQEPLAPYIGNGMGRANITGPDITPHEYGLSLVKKFEQLETNDER